MQTATKRGSPPRARRGASPHFFGGSPAGAPARQAGGFGVWGRAGPAPPAPGPSRQVPHGGKRVRGAALGKKPAGAHGGKGCAVRRWGKGQVRRGQKGRQAPHGGKRVRGAAREKRPAGAARVPAGPLSPGRKCRRGLPGRRRPPRGSRGGRGKRERGDFPFSPPLASPAPSPGTRTAPVRRGCGMCGGGKAGAAGFPRRGMPRRGIGPQKRGGAGGGNPPPALSPFLFAAPLGRRRTFFGTFCGALPTHKSIGRVRTRRRCRRRDFAGRPPRCRPRGRWSGGCRQRGARPPR